MSTVRVISLSPNRNYASFYNKVIQRNFLLVEKKQDLRSLIGKREHKLVRLEFYFLAVAGRPELNRNYLRKNYSGVFSTFQQSES
ncbi:hypothetical protein DU42_17950 [Methanosarcina mazei]|uniref:Uncharacterized protein n=1 Tax=Methanosarcina mazei TaxID=2209 RepID=A0A0F8KGZ9_METMZ|nr:hypothetical protein DU42_17950 [Methanosarcina mazei]